MNTKFRSASFTIAGSGKINEDSADFQIIGDDCVAVVADGVGGNYGGGVASALAVKEVIELLTASPNSSIEQIFAAASRIIKEKGNTDLISNQMATTLSLCLVDSQQTAHVGHVGVSRIYHLRGKGIVQRTKDQTEVAALVEAGILSREQAKSYPRRTVLRSALSAKGTYELFETTFPVASGDRIILLTDGIYRLVTKSQLRDLSLSSTNIEELSRKIRADISNKNDDDATLVIIEID